MNYFRAIYHKQEISKRAFDLTTETIMMNPGNYTAWYFRRKLIDELKLPLADEIEYLNSVGLDLEKNYQIWHHRRCIMEVYQSGFE